MNYQEFLTELFKIKRFGKTPNLLVMQKMLKKLGNPQEKLKFIHIAGTNGKGSVSNYIASCLMEKGYKVGLFTSPFIHTFNERFKINNENISDSELSLIGTKVFDIVKEIDYDVKQFDIITAIALYWFNKNNCDYVVLEAGMGGRNDSTNIVNPIASVITTIDLDHTKILGSTVSQIAYEKAGIIKKNIPLFYYPTECSDIFIKECKLNNASYTTIDEPVIISNYLYGSKFLYKNTDYEIRMLGKYQIYNACLAIEVLKNLKVEDRYIKKGLLKMKLEGRFEKISDNPMVFIDGGHNPQGAKSIVEAVKYHNISNPIYIVSVYKEKDANGFLNNLKGNGDIILTSFDDELSHNPYELKESFDYPVINLEDIVKLVKHSKDDKTFIFCGSIYQISKIKTLFFKTR